MRVPAATLIALAVTAPLFAAAVPGEPAPAFTAHAADGRTVHLADYAGKTVVLEWNNPGCPFVQKHYGSGNMQRTQAAARAQGVVWLSVNSSAPGQQGSMNDAEAVAFVKAKGASPSAYLMDPAGQLGHLYGAKTTPHMFVIAPNGRVVYAGAIDDIASADSADIPKAHNLVLAALGDMKAGRPVTAAQARAYGCSVKYAS